MNICLVEMEVAMTLLVHAKCGYNIIYEMTLSTE